MSKKAKEKELNFMFLDSDANMKNKKHKPRVTDSTSVTRKKNVGTGSARPSKNQATRSSQNLKKNNIVHTTKSTSKKSNSKVSKQRKPDPKKRRRMKIISNIIKWIILLGMLTGAIIFFMLTPLFNVKSIAVNGNAKISSEAVIIQSGIQLESNTFKINKRNVINNLKQNPYIESVKIKRILPSSINIEMNERQAKFSIQYIGGYIYVDEQGYLLEKSGEDIFKLIIVGAATPIEQLELGNRLIYEDLTTLETVYKILDSAKNNGIYNLITKVDISNRENIILYLEDEDKTVEIGNGGDLNTKMLHINKILEKERGKPGIIIINQDVNKANPYFREEV